MLLIELTDYLVTAIIIIISGAIAYWLACSTWDRKVPSSSPLATGGCVANVGQLLFAPWAWAYSTLHP